MDIVFNNIKRLSAFLLMMLISYSFLRFLFLIFNWQIYNKYGVDELLLSFIYGIRFDISAIFTINCIFLIMSFIPFNFFQNIFYKYLILIFNSLCMSFGFIDIEYYKFVGSRLNASILLQMGDVREQGLQIIVNHWHLTLISLILFVSLAKVYNKFIDIVIWIKSYKYLWFILVIPLYVLGVRGGWQEKVLKPIHAYTIYKGGSSDIDLMSLTLNSPFTFLKTSVYEGVKKVSYFEKMEEAIETISQPRLKSDPIKKKDNVVIIILESFATEFWGVLNEGRGFTPFLDDLSKKGLLFKNHFANGRRSIEAFPSIVLGIPSMMNVPIIKSPYQFNKWHGLGDAFKKAGYRTSFFHGAASGSMYFDSTSYMAGFTDHYSLEKYPNKKDHDGHWGIYDEPFFQYMIGELEKHREPFFSVVFTLSSHQPYPLPPDKKNMFPKGSLDIHESIGYVDYAVKKFFEEAKRKKWYDRTLFVITADHTQKSESPFYNSALGRFMVPLLFYHPGRKLIHDNLDRVVHQADIFPSLLDFMGLESRRLLFGRSVFDARQEGEALLYLGGSFWIIQQNYFLQFIEDTEDSYLYELKDRLQQNPIYDNKQEHQRLFLRLKAYIQYYKNGLIHNNLYDW